jgi:glycine cleavage system H protein
MLSSIPDHLSYTKEHEWLETVSENRVRFGITDYAQSALGDIVYIQLPELGKEIQSGKVCGEVESTKSVSEIYAPVSGKVVLINNALSGEPETINRDPYRDGWIAEVEVSGPGETISASDYRTLVGE